MIDWQDRLKLCDSAPETGLRLKALEAKFDSALTKQSQIDSDFSIRLKALEAKLDNNLSGIKSVLAKQQNILLLSCSKPAAVDSYISIVTKDISPATAPKFKKSPPQA